MKNQNLCVKGVVTVYIFIRDRDLVTRCAFLWPQRLKWELGYFSSIEISLYSNLHGNQPWTAIYIAAQYINNMVALQ